MECIVVRVRTPPHRSSAFLASQRQRQECHHRDAWEVSSVLVGLLFDWLSNLLNAQGGPLVLKVGFSTRMGADHMDIDRLSSISGIWSATETSRPPFLTFQRL